MKIRQPWLIKAAGFFAAWVLRLWLGTLRHRHRSLGPNVDPRRRECRQRYIYAFWHEGLLLAASQYGHTGVHVLISQHADGELIAEVCRHLGFRAVRGSTTRGGVEALRQMLKVGRHAHLGITPDGPRGPRRQVQPGLVYLAAKTGLAIVPGGIAYDRPWRTRSWDRFAMPRPWSRAACVTGEPIIVPADATREELEQYRRRVEEALLRVTEAAERLAAGARLAA
ncbi:MAG TPA: lysophospholipid acyltransferase family protein [Gemmataceae bacterium]|nr:lysophospholipid acyltransferase family protein [Gemmataceae bacterium]